MTAVTSHAQSTVEATARAARRCGPRALLLPAALVGLLVAVLFGVLTTWLVGVLIGGALATAIFLVGVRRGRDRAIPRILEAVGARELRGEEFPRYRNLVEGLSAASGVPEPDLYVVDEAAPNLMALGAPGDAALVATSGLFEVLNRVELEAVLSEGICLIRDHRADLGTQAAAFAAGPLLTRRPRDGAPPRSTIARSGRLVRALGPLLEPSEGFEADLRAVGLTRYPPALGRALEKLAEAGTVVPTCPWGVAHLWICDPLVDADPGTTAGELNRRFAHEPPLRHRIDLLAEL